MKTKIYFRADGHAKMGLGHVIRSLALAEMLMEDFDCHFIIRKPLPVLKSQILEVCKSIIELPETDDHNAEAQMLADKYLSGEGIVVLDGYHFRTEYQRIIKNKDCKLVCIDDIHAYHFVADAVINHAGGVTSGHYSAEPYTKFYLGLKYALLRKAFTEAADTIPFHTRGNGVFICLGGADPNNDTLAVLKKCESRKGINKCYVVLGGAYSYINSIQRFLDKTNLEVELLNNLSAQEIASYMQRCRFAITPPSTVSYEYLRIGGILYLKQIADNQKDIKKYFINSGLAFDFDEQFLKLSDIQISRALEKQRSAFAFNTPATFFELFKNLSNSSEHLPVG